MRRPKYRKVRLSNFEKQQIYDYYDNKVYRKQVAKAKKVTVLNYQGSPFGELNFWY